MYAISLKSKLLLGLLVIALNRLSSAGPSDAEIYLYARSRVEEVGRQEQSLMPAWLKANREAYRARLAQQAKKSFEETGIWFLARGASRFTDEQETEAVWCSLLMFGDLESLPGYSKENHAEAIEFWQSWQNLETGKLYNPLYQDPQNPDTKRNTPGNRGDYSAESINTKYIPNILEKLGAELPKPVNAVVRADEGVDTFDELWKWRAEWATSPAGAFPVAAAREVDAGRLDKIPQVEAGMGALVRAYHPATGMWRPEPLERLPWTAYDPSSGFKIISRICGYVGMENFPQPLANKAIDNLIAHKSELYADPSTARNYSEMMAHYLMLTDYRRDELLDAMEECLNGFRDSRVWESTATGSYAVFGSGMIGAFMNWEDLPFDQALQQWIRFEHGCQMKWRFVVDPYGTWVNVIPKEQEAVFGHAEYDVKKYGLKARNRSHWSKQIRDVVPQREVALKHSPDGTAGRGMLEFHLTEDQLAGLKAPYLKATWSGAYDIHLNGELVKKVRYNLPDAIAGWYIPEAPMNSLRVGRNEVKVELTGKGKDQAPGAPISETHPSIRLGIIDWN